MKTKLFISIIVLLSVFCSCTEEVECGELIILKSKKAMIEEIIEIAEKDNLSIHIIDNGETNFTVVEWDAIKLTDDYCFECGNRKFNIIDLIKTDAHYHYIQGLNNWYPAIYFK